MNSEREELEARIAAYIDGTLPPADAARLEVFLANTDAKLAEQVIGMIGDKHRVANLPKPRAPDDLAARILEQVERTTLLNNVDQITHRRPWWQSRAAVAAALFLFLGSFTYFILQAIHPANPAWQAALEPTHHQNAEAPSPATSVPAAPAAPVEGVLAQADTTVAAGSNLAAATQNTIAAPLPSASIVAAAPRFDSFQKSSNAITADQPVMLTFFAQDANDERRLRDTLETLQAAGTASASLSFRSDRDRGNAGITSELAGSSPTGSAAVQNNSNQYNPQSPVPDRAASNSVAQNNQQQSQALPSATAEAANVAAASSPASPAAQKTLTAEEKKAPAYPVSYHVALRPADIEQLTRQFHLQPTDRTASSIPHGAIAGFGGVRAMGVEGGGLGAATVPADTFDKKLTDQPATLPSTVGDDEMLKDIASKRSNQATETRINCIITISPGSPPRQSHMP